MLYRGFHVGTPSVGELTGRRRQHILMEIESVHDHGQTAELHADVGAGGEHFKGGAPFGEDLIAFATIRPNTQRPADMVEHHGHIGKSTRQIDQLADLGVIQPSIVRQSVFLQQCKSGTECRIGHQAEIGWCGHAGQEGFVAGGNLPNAAETPRTGFDMGFQYRVDLLAQAEIGVTDDARSDPSFHLPPFGLRHDRGNEIGFADWFHFLRSGRPVGPEALQEDRGDDVVARLHIGQKIIEEIGIASVVPQVMMRIDDRKGGFQHFLGQARQPCGVGQRVA